jgi:hypothetical protein
MTALTRASIQFQIQIHYFTESLVALGIEPGTSGSVARNSDY